MSVFSFKRRQWRDPTCTDDRISKPITATDNLNVQTAILVSTLCFDGKVSLTNSPSYSHAQRTPIVSVAPDGCWWPRTTWKLHDGTQQTNSTDRTMMRPTSTSQLGAIQYCLTDGSSWWDTHTRTSSSTRPTAKNIGNDDLTELSIWGKTLLKGRSWRGRGSQSTRREEWYV